MVCNKFRILDESEIKFVPECIEMKKPEYVYKFESEIAEMNSAFHAYEAKKVLYQQGVYQIEQLNDLYRKCESYKENEFLYRYVFCDEVPNSKSEYNRIAKYYNIKPFVPSVMINISPDWNGEGIDKRSNACKIKILQGIIENYMKEGWYSNWEYVIENGSDGNHIHAHCVCQLNPDRIKSTESHLRRGNHTRQLMKYAKKLRGLEGIIKGVSVQKIILRNETLVKDKLLYLHEDTKPEGHKNKSVINDGYKTGCLNLTAK